MAAAFSRRLQSFLRINNLTFRYSNGSCNRFYSVFAPDFKEPVLDENEIINILKTESPEEILAVRRKPAPNSFSSSVLYHPDVNLFTNYVMTHGKKETAQRLVHETFTRVKHIQLRKYNKETDLEKKEKIIINPLEVFLVALENVKPLMWYSKIRKSGSWYKVPVGISAEKSKRRAMKWLIEAANEKNKLVRFELELANELVAALSHEGKAINKKLELHKMCEANRGYVHYWWT